MGEENEIPVSAVLLPDFSHISQQERLNPPAIHLSAEELQMGELESDEKKAHTIIIKNVGNLIWKFVICRCSILLWGSS